VTGFPHLLCRRAGLGAAHGAQDGLACGTRCARRRHPDRRRDLRQQPPLEKSLRLQNADLLTEYNLVEADLARPKVKAADFRGKAAYLEQRERPHQPAMLCTLTVTDNVDKDGVARFPIGNCPIVDPKTDEVLIDSLGRRSYTTSLAYGPVGRKEHRARLSAPGYCEEGRQLEIEYFNQKFPVQVEAVGMKALYDPTNERMRS
jgi:glycine cleavage system aminomethyltransferase T